MARTQYKKIDPNQLFQTILFLSSQKSDGKVPEQVKEALLELTDYDDEVAFLRGLEDPKVSVLDRTERLIYSPFELEFVLEPSQQAIIPLCFIVPETEKLYISEPHDPYIVCENLMLKGKYNEIGSVARISNYSGSPTLIKCDKNAVLLRAMDKNALDRLLHAIMVGEEEELVK